jgi:hypothetical protein
MIPDEGVTEFISYLMEVDKEAVNKVLTTRVMETQRGGRRGKHLPAYIPSGEVELSANELFTV